MTSATITARNSWNLNEGDSRKSFLSPSSITSPPSVITSYGLNPYNSKKVDSTWSKETKFNEAWVSTVMRKSSTGS